MAPQARYQLHNGGTVNTQDFNKSRVGSVAMEGCEVCGGATGTILMQPRAAANAPEYVGPRVVRVQGALCEHCRFLDAWLHTGFNPRMTWAAAAKIVTEDDKGVRTLVAFVPFTDIDDNHTVTMRDEGQVTLKHGMLILAERSADGVQLVRVLERSLGDDRVRVGQHAPVPVKAIDSAVALATADDDDGLDSDGCH